MREKAEEILSQVLPGLSDDTTYEAMKKKFDEDFIREETLYLKD